jgi:hypothetical protein
VPYRLLPKEKLSLFPGFQKGLNDLLPRGFQDAIDAIQGGFYCRILCFFGCILYILECGVELFNRQSNVESLYRRALAADFVAFHFFNILLDQVTLAVERAVTSQGKRQINRLGRHLDCLIDAILADIDPFFNRPSGNAVSLSFRSPE